MRCVSLRRMVIHAQMIFALLPAFAMPLATAGEGAVGAPDPGLSVPWTQDLNARLARIQEDFPGELGVHVRDLDSGESVSMRAEEIWYLASGIKVPVAIAVVRAIENGTLALDSRIVLEASDYVDGAGSTNSHRPGTPLQVDYLVDQMLVYSDNTATDMLIRTVGLDRVQAVARELMVESDGAITTLADVRRHLYSALHGDAFQLSGNDLLALRRSAAGSARIDRLAQLLGVSRSQFLMTDLDSAYDAYYASGLNAAPLTDYAQVLVALAEGRALAPEGTGYVIDVMSRVATGDRRIKAGLPRGTVFAHKTGTQHRRACDFGIALRGDAEGGRRVIIAACTRGAVPLARSEQALRAVGAAVAASGVFDQEHAVRTVAGR